MDSLSLECIKQKSLNYQNKIVFTYLVRFNVIFLFIKIFLALKKVILFACNSKVL